MEKTNLICTACQSTDVDACSDSMISVILSLLAAWDTLEITFSLNRPDT